MVPNPQRSQHASAETMQLTHTTRRTGTRSLAYPVARLPRMLAAYIVDTSVVPLWFAPTDDAKPAVSQGHRGC